MSGSLTKICTRSSAVWVRTERVTSTAERRNVPPVMAHECGTLMVKAPSRGSFHCTNVTTGRTRASLADCGPGDGLPPCDDATPGSRLLSATRMTDTRPECMGLAEPCARALSGSLDDHFAYLNGGGQVGVVRNVGHDLL